MNDHEKINYLEIPAKHMNATKTFFAKVFGWSFVDYGPDYISFSGAGIEGGFVLSDQIADSGKGSVLIVFYSEKLEQTLSKIEAAQGLITKSIFDFPGGRRFHFCDPNGNEFAVWSDRGLVDQVE